MNYLNYRLLREDGKRNFQRLTCGKMLVKIRNGNIRSKSVEYTTYLLLPRIKINICYERKITLINIK